jgi:glycosyltransferase involved in cell wall biosynthesis
MNNTEGNGKNILYIHAGAEMYGADRILLELVNGMKSYGWKPLVLLPNNGPLVKEFEQRGIKVEVMPFPVLRRKYFTVIGIFNYFQKLITHIQILKKMIKEKDIHLIHSNTLAVLPGLFAAKMAKVPHVWHVHEIITRPKFLNKLLSNIAGVYSDKIVAVSTAVMEHFTRTNQKAANKTEVIYNGIDTELFKPINDPYFGQNVLGLDPNVQIFGMIGRINRWKGQLLLLNAAEKVLKKVKNSHCLFIGGVFENETFYRDKLIEEIKEKGLQDKVTVLDFQKDPENAHRYFNIFVLPSVEPDPLPTVVLEAMATSVPLVANAHGGAIEMVVNKETGFLAEVNNENELAKHIVTLLENPEMAINMGKKGRQRVVNKFSKKRFFDDFSHLYNTLVNK